MTLLYSWTVLLPKFLGKSSFVRENTLNKNAITAFISLAWFEIRSRKEEALNSTRNSIYSLKVYYFLLYRCRYFLFLNWFSTRVRDDRKYVCGSRLYACINTRKFKCLDSREITPLPEINKVIYMACHFNHRRKWTACSSQDAICIQWKCTTPDHRSLLKILFFFSDHSVVFTCSKVTNAFKR